MLPREYAMREIARYERTKEKTDDLREALRSFLLKFSPSVIQEIYVFMGQNKRHQEARDMVEGVYWVKMGEESQ